MTNDTPRLGRTKKPPATTAAPAPSSIRRTIVLGWPAELLSLNDRHHYRKQAPITKAWRQHAYARFVDMALAGVTYDTARIVVTYRFPDNRRRDVGNLQITSKAIVDGIVDTGILKDDSDMFLIGPDNRREWPNGPHRITVTIEPVGVHDAA